jgi:tetratricopeptide (TPR) repeat protein
LQIDPKNCEAIYCRGLIARLTGKFEKAVQIYEEVINLNTSEQYTLKSLHNIALIRIEERDLYQAYHTLDRLETIPSSFAVIANTKAFLEGAISLVKKKYNEGILAMDTLVLMESEDAVKEMAIAEELKPLIRSFRAYGNFCEGNIGLAISDFEELEKRKQLSFIDQYNLQLCLGVTAAELKGFEEARKHFLKAKQMNPNKIEPRFYLAILDILVFIEETKEQFEYFVANVEKERNGEYCKKLTVAVFTSLETLEAVQAENDSCPNLAFYIGYLKLSIGLFHESVENFSLAIQKSDIENPIHMLWKGIALCMCDNYEEALGDFREALRKEPNMYQAGLLKGRCYLHLKNVERAMVAFNDFIENSSEEEQEIKYYLGCFFYHNGLVSHARQAFEDAADIRPVERTLRELTKVYISEKNTLLAMGQLNHLCELYPKPVYTFDLAVLNSLKIASTGDFRGALSALPKDVPSADPSDKLVFVKADIVFYRMIFNFYAGKMQEAWDLHEEAIQLAYPKNDDNANIMEIFKREEDIIKELFAEELDEDLLIDTMTFTRLESEYNRFVLALMRGESRLTNGTAETGEQPGSTKSTHLDRQFGLNKAAMKEGEREAVERLENMLKWIKGEDSEFLDLSQPSNGQGGIDIHEKSTFEGAKVIKEKSPPGGSPTDRGWKGYSESLVIKLEESIKEMIEALTEGKKGKSYICKIFPFNNRLCGIFEPVSKELSSGAIIRLRPSFCLPRMDLPTTTISASYEIIRNLAITSVENVPEAPWVKRSDTGVIYTNNVIQEEAVEVEDLQTLITSVQGQAKVPLPEAMRQNLAKLFEGKRTVDAVFPTSPDTKLARLKRDLMLDPRTNDRLNKLVAADAKPKTEQK